MKLSTLFSSKSSALVLGATFVVSTMFAGVSYAQSLTIPTNMDNAAIAIKNIFLSPTGTSKQMGSTIQLNGVDGTINVIAPSGSIVPAGITTPNLNVSNNIVLSKLKCRTQDVVIGPGGLIPGGDLGRGNGEDNGLVIG